MKVGQSTAQVFRTVQPHEHHLPRSKCTPSIEKLGKFDVGSSAMHERPDCCVQLTEWGPSSLTIISSVGRRSNTNHMFFCYMETVSESLRNSGCTHRLATISSNAIQTSPHQFYRPIRDAPVTMPERPPACALNRANSRSPLTIRFDQQCRGM